MLTTALCLESLVGDTNAFFASYWNRTPAVHRGTADKFSSLLSVDDLDAMLTFGGLRDPYVRMTSDGRPLHATRFMRSIYVRDFLVPQVLDTDNAASEFGAGATLTLDALDHHHRPAQLLRDILAAELRCPVGTVGFVTPANTPGLSVHHDNTEVFVLQTFGTKKWTIYAQNRPLPSHGKVYRESDLGIPILEVELQPGDCLYIPWGAPHRAESGSSASGHVSVMAQPPTWSAIVKHMIDSVFEPDRFDGVWAADGIDQLSHDGTQHLREAVAGLRAADVHALLTGYLDQHQPKPQAHAGFLQRTAKRSQVTASTILHRNPAVGFILSDAADATVLVRVDQRTFRYPGSARATLHLLSHATEIAVGNIQQDLGDADLLKLTRHLLSVGVFTASA